MAFQGPACDSGIEREARSAARCIGRESEIAEASAVYCKTGRLEIAAQILEQDSRVGGTNLRDAGCVELQCPGQAGNFSVSVLARARSMLVGSR